jgi:hypothetical protein
MDNISVVSNGRCRPLVQSCVPFRGSNLFADTQDNGIYVVWSYGLHFPLFAKVGSQWYENDDRYSVTTSKQSGQAHPHAETIKVSCAELKSIIEK